MRNANGLRVISLATLVAFAAVTAHTAPVAATDPSPSPAPVETPTPSPTTDPTPAPTIDPAPSPTADPSPTTDPSPTVDPSPAPTTDPSPSPDPAPSVDPSPSPATEPVPQVSPDPAVTTVAVAPKPDLGVRVARIALAQRHKRYVRGAAGPRAFDCSGLVRFAYRKAGVGGHLGGGHSARAMLRWGRRHGLTSRTHPQVGDVVIYGNGTHAAIYIGHGLVISALNPRQGIRITRLHALTARFTTFIHTHI